MKQNTLRYYQEEDTEKGLNMRSFLLNLPRGAGKTAIILHIIHKMRILRYISSGPILILVPVPVIPQWEEETRKWGLLDGISFIYKEGVKEDTSPQDNCVYVMNYETLLSKRFAQFYGLKSETRGSGPKARFSLIICDESHRIKNRKAKRTDAVLALSKEFGIAVSGTPVMKTPNDLWTQLKFLSLSENKSVGAHLTIPPELMSSYHRFIENFCRLEVNIHAAKRGIRLYDPVGLTTNVTKQQELNKILSSVTVTRSIGDLGFKSEILRNRVPLSMDRSSRQAKLYEATRKLIWEEIDEASVSISNAAVHSLRLRQLTTCPGVLDASVGLGLKFDYITELLTDDSDEKYLVFSNWAGPAHYLQQEVNKGTKGVPHLFKDKFLSYHGGLNDAERARVLTKFKTSPEKRVLFATIGSLGEGVDGLQNVCNRMIFLDIPWSPGILEQAEGRLHRMGQTKPVFVEYLEIVGTVDKAVYEIVHGREKDIRKLFVSK